MQAAEFDGGLGNKARSEVGGVGVREIVQDASKAREVVGGEGQSLRDGIPPGEGHMREYIDREKRQLFHAEIVGEVDQFREFAVIGSLYGTSNRNLSPPLHDRPDSAAHGVERIHTANRAISFRRRAIEGYGDIAAEVGSGIGVLVEREAGGQEPESAAATRKDAGDIGPLRVKERFAAGEEHVPCVESIKFFGEGARAIR